jgi:SIR2-like protein
LAALPATLREKGYPPRHQLIVTTNYDDLLERAFQTAGEPFDLVSYIAEGEQRGKFLHWPHQGEARLIEKPNEYRGLALDQRTVILKIHGAVDRLNPEQDSYVITEDHYIDYLTRTDISNLIPATLAAKLRRSHFLFLGYSLRDWNLRVILHRIWGAQKLTYKSWAIQLDPQPLDQEFWRKRDVDILNVRLEDYVATLNERIQALPLYTGART